MNINYYVIPGLEKPEEMLFRRVGKYLNISGDRIRSRNRNKALVFARHLFCYFAYIYTDMTQEKIAEFLGYDNHTTVLHAIKTMEDYKDSIDVRGEMLLTFQQELKEGGWIPVERKYKTINQKRLQSYL